MIIGFQVCLSLGARTYLFKATYRFPARSVLLDLAEVVALGPLGVAGSPGLDLLDHRLRQLP
jgi:hypothetical protein